MMRRCDIAGVISFVVVQLSRYAESEGSRVLRDKDSGKGAAHLRSMSMSSVRGRIMPIHVKCPACGATFPATDESAGKRGKCPKCQGKIEIPAPVAAVAAESDSTTGYDLVDDRAGKRYQPARSSTGARSAGPTGPARETPAARESARGSTSWILAAFQGE